MSNRCIYYVVEIFYDYDSKSYSAVFCDFPDVKSNGKTINEAMDNAENDLHNFIKSMVKEEKQIPFPKSIQSIKKKNKRRKKRKRESLFIPIPVPMNLIDGLGQIHNSTYKRIFGFKEAFKDLIDGFFPKEFVEIVDYDSLERQPDSFISSQFSELRDDLIWRLRTKDDKCYYIYILTEFQRANVYYMAARIDEYVGELRMDLIRSGVVKSNELLPVIFPIVIYNGVTKWTAPLTLDDIQVKADESILSYSKQRYFLIDIHRLVEESIEGRETIPAIFFRMERAKNFEELIIILKDAYEHLKGEHYNDIRYSLLHWVKAEAIPRYELPIELFKNVNSLEELTDMSYVYASQEDKKLLHSMEKRYRPESAIS